MISSCVAAALALAVPTPRTVLDVTLRHTTPRCSVGMQQPYGQQPYGQQPSQQQSQQQYGPPQQDDDATRDSAPLAYGLPVTWKLAGTETPGSRNKSPGPTLDGSYSIGNGEQQVLGRYDMAQTRGRPAYYVSRQQCLIEVAPDGQAILTSIGKPPTGWRPGPEQPWRWVRKKSKPVVLNSGAQLSLNKYEEYGAIFTCLQQAGAPPGRAAPSGRAASPPGRAASRLSGRSQDWKNAGSYGQQGAYGMGYPGDRPQGRYGQRDF